MADDAGSAAGRTSGDVVAEVAAATSIVAADIGVAKAPGWTCDGGSRVAVEGKLTGVTALGPGSKAQSLVKDATTKGSAGTACYH